MLKLWHLGPIALFWLCVFGIGTVNADLIEPTHTLDEQLAASGVISVFSDPPGMQVRLDGSNFGETPMQAVQVPTGPHVLQVGSKSTQIQVSSGTPLKVSLFQGEFITLQESLVIETVQKSSPPPETAKSAEPKQKEGPLNPPNSFYFPINPRGPIY